MGRVNLGTTAIDRSKFKANSSRHKTMSYGRMVTTLQALETELKELRASLTAHKAAKFDVNKLGGEIARREKRRTTINAAKERIEDEAIAKGEAVDDMKQKSFDGLDALPLAEVPLSNPATPLSGLDTRVVWRSRLSITKSSRSFQSTPARPHLRIDK